MALDPEVERPSLHQIKSQGSAKDHICIGHEEERPDLPKHHTFSNDVRTDCRTYSLTVSHFPDLLTLLQRFHCQMTLSRSSSEP